MKTRVILILSFLFLFFLSGCSQRLGDFTILSTKNVEVGANYTKIKTSSAEDMKLYFIFPMGTPNIENAVDQLLEKEGGDLLTNAVLTYEYKVFLIFGTYGYSVKGDIWKRTELGKSNESEESYQLTVRDGEYYLVASDNSEEKIQVKHKRD